MPLEGESFDPARLTRNATAPSKASPHHFEMVGHRGLLACGWKAVAYHPPGTPSRTTKGALVSLDDFSETDDIAGKEPEASRA